MQVWKTTGKKPKEFNIIKPEKLLYLIDYFYELKTTKDAINYLEIKTWCELTKKQLQTWEIKAIKQIDFTFNNTLTNG